MIKKSSIDISEVDKFDRLSTKWWDREGEFKILHEISPLRLEFIKNKIRQHFRTDNSTNSLENLEILDVGCGGGLISVPLARLGADLTSIDASLENIKAASSYTNKANLKINYLNTTVEELVENHKHKKFDVVLCLEVIEHVTNVENFIENLASLIKPSGMLILSTINRNIKSYLLAILIAEYILSWVPKKTHDHSKFLKPSELNLLLTRNQLTLKELKGLTFNPLKRIWQLCPNIDVNYFAYAIKM